MDALNHALHAIERAHAGGLTAMQICTLVNAASGVPISVARARAEASLTRDGVERPKPEDRNLTSEQISAALRAAALELATREQQRIREQTLLVRARHWLARLLQAAARAIVPPPSGLRRRQP